MSLEAAKGEFVVIMGHSEAGKSTLCTSLNGLIPHFFRGWMEGEVRVGGRSTREGKVGEFAGEVGLVFQDFEAQLFSTNVALEVAFGPENFEVEREEMVRRVKSVLGQVRLEGFDGRQPATLLGSQKQRLAIASVLAIEPRILGPDEPTTDLAPIGKLGFNDMLGFVPFAALSTIITFNNLIAGAVLSPIFLLVLYPRVKRWGLLWTEIMSPEERFPRRGSRGLGTCSCGSAASEGWSGPRARTRTLRAVFRCRGLRSGCRGRGRLDDRLGPSAFPRPHSYRQLHVRRA